MRLKTRYKQYLTGGDLTQVLSLLGPTVDSLDPGNAYGRQHTATTALKGALSGAAAGTSIMPGIGTLAGGAVGALTGFISGNQARKQEEAMRFNQSLMERDQQLKRSAAVIAADPALVTGNRGAEFYAHGGQLKKSYYNSVKAVGGSLRPLSSNSAEVVGPSHQQGGVDLPQYNSEVEGGETLQGDYVFSDRLGFARRHRQLAKAIGKIEEKPATPDRINSLRRLHQSVENLKALQEQIRTQNNLQ